jgi:succinoglycan biosynthesis transport protein ExoP
MGEETKKGSGGLDLALAVWHRRKWLGILIFLVPFTVAVSLALFLPDLYQATATVLVERQLVPENFVQPTVTSALETRLHTISQEILSRSRLEALVNQFGLYPELRKKLSTDEVIESMRRDIKLELKSADVKGQERQATVAFAISYRGVDPNTVALVTNTLASFYIEENLKVRQRQAVGTTEFLQVQLDETKKKVDEQEKQVSEFKRRYLGELPQQMDANMATLERLNMQLRMNVDSQTRASERRQLLASQLAEAETVGVTGPGGTMAEPESPSGRLARLKRELPTLLTRFSEKYPDVIQTKAEIAALEKQLAETKSDEKGDPKPVVPSSPYVMRLREAKSEADSEAKVLKNEEKRLRDAIAVYQSRLDNVPRREQEFKEFSRDYESTRNLYQTLLKRYEEAQLAESMEQRQKGEQFRILDPAVPAREPLARRTRLILTSLMLSLGLAAVGVVLAEQADSSFHNIDDLRRFSIVPVLASIPRIVCESDVTRQKRRFRIAAAATALGLLMLVVITYFVASGNEQLGSLLSQGRM